MTAFDLRDGEHLERELGALEAEFPSLPRELIERALAEGSGGSSAPGSASSYRSWRIASPAIGCANWP